MSKATNRIDHLGLRRLALPCFLAAVVLAITACAVAGTDHALRGDAAQRFGRLAAPAGAPSAEAKLGRALFWDTRLSADGKTACASCHLAQDWGADRRAFSIDARNKPSSRHSPTVFNSMSQPSLRWLGDRRNGAEQAEGSITGSMGFASKADAVHRLHELGYAPAFRGAFPQDADPVSARNYGQALQAYQASLVTPAPFDRFLEGDNRALTAQQKSGLRLFVDMGCAGCHGGALFGGSTFQRFGLVRDYWLATGSTRIDEGRYAQTKKEEDRYVFRVPMLRNVARTAPYFHDGSVPTLEAAVRVMAAVQLGRSLEPREVDLLVAFLESLSGDVPWHYSAPGS